MTDNLYKLIEDNWIDANKAPKYFSFRCIIKFKEFGFDGPQRNHLSTGYWWHLDMDFSIDNAEMKHLTPIAFIPLYESI